MQNDLRINEKLIKEDILLLFKSQLKKDFEGAGLDGDFTAQLPAQYEEICYLMKTKLEPLISGSSHKLAALLYRVDVSERQLRDYQELNPSLVFTDVIAELIIKRILQKVILKKTFSR